MSVRLTLWHSILFLASGLAVLGLTYALLRNRVTAEERDVVVFRLNQYAGEYARGGLPALRALANLRKGRAQKAFFVRVAGPENQTLFLRDAEEWAEFNPGSLAGAPLPASGQREWIVLRSAGKTELLIGSERSADGATVQVGKSNEDLLALLAAYKRTAVLVLMVFLPASFLGGAFLASRALRPVQHLTRAAGGIIKTARFDARVPSPGSGDELDALVRVFNEMLGRIDALVRGMRDSIDNVAHDLRTPMTRLRNRAQEVLESGSGVEVACEALAECIEEADRVLEMLNALMEIAETEARLVQFNRVPVALAAIVDRTIEAYAELADEKKVSVTADVPVEVEVLGDEMALARVMANLLDNAIKYSRAGGHVEVTVNRIGEMAVIRVTDHGIGIPEEELSKIWERLFRGDKSRSERGLGLGLSIVRAIVEVHGGTVAARSELEKGTTIEVRLPIPERVGTAAEPFVI